jgi:repressor LexA
MPLTERQRAVLDFIRECHDREGIMPSTREIQAHFGFASQTAVVNHLRALERKGAIHRQPGKARAVALASQRGRQRIVDVPVYGLITAGFAEDEAPEALGTLSVDAASTGLESHGEHFALKVRGDSMVGAQICDGDLVILERRPARHGDIVAALIDGETTLKRLVKEDGRVFLRAENPHYPDLIPVREMLIQGVMAALVRRCQRRKARGNGEKQKPPRR